MGTRRIAAGGDTVFTSQIDALVAESPKSSGDPPTVVLFRNGEEVMRTQASELHYGAPPIGTYRVEIRLPIPGVLVGSRMLPVIYSSRIRILEDPPPSPLTSPSELDGFGAP